MVRGEDKRKTRRDKKAKARYNLYKKGGKYRSTKIKQTSIKQEKKRKGKKKKKK